MATTAEDIRAPRHPVETLDRFFSGDRLDILLGEVLYERLVSLSILIITRTSIVVYTGYLGESHQRWVYATGVSRYGTLEDFETPSSRFTLWVGGGTHLLGVVPTAFAFRIYVHESVVSDGG